MACRAAALSGVVWACLPTPAHAEDKPKAAAPPCATLRAEPDTENAEVVFAKGRARAAAGDYAHARGYYAWVLERYPQDRDVRLSLALTYAWEHCYALAETRYRALLSEKPEDVDARIALVDVLLWQDRRAEAEREADQGLALFDRSAELWRRRAALYLRADDPVRAADAATRAVKLAPDDIEARLLRDRIYLTQLRLSVRADRVSGDYPNLYTAEFQAWHRVQSVELTADIVVVDRAGGAQPTAAVDSLYTLGASYHFGPPATVGVNLGLGEPGRALPTFTNRVWIESQISGAWLASLAYALWHYRGDNTLHFFAPALTFTPVDPWIFDLRWWTTWLVRADGGQLRHAFGVRAVHVLLPGFRLGLSYTYGAQFTSAIVNFDTLRSHVVAFYADFRPVKLWGLQPFVGLEQRNTKNASLWVVAFELASYIRW